MYKDLEMKHRELERKFKTLEENTQMLKKEIEELKQDNKILRETNQSYKTKTWDTGVSREDLLGIKTYGEFLTVKDRMWKEDIFSNVTVVHGSPPRSGDMSLVIAEPEDVEMEKNIQKIYKDRYPELVEMKEDYGVLTSVTTILGSKGKKDTTKTIIKMTSADMEIKLWKALVKVKESLEMNKILRLTTYGVTNISEDCFKKMLQCIFMGTKINIDIYTLAKENRAPTYSDKLREKSRKTTSAITLAKAGVEFNALLNTVKEALKNTEDKSIIKKVRSTRNGELLLITDKDDEKVKKLQQTLRENTTDVKVRYVGDGSRKTSLFVRDLDATTTKTDVKQALKATLGELNTEVQVGELRPTRKNTQTTTIMVNQRGARKLINTMFVEVGLAKAKIEERINLIQCFKCWHYGHRAEECEADVDRKGTCFRCGEVGHKAAVCGNALKCLICDEPGHRMGSGGCRQKGKELRRARKHALLKTKEVKDDQKF